MIRKVSACAFVSLLRLTEVLNGFLKDLPFLGEDFDGIVESLSLDAKSVRVSSRSRRVLILEAVISIFNCATSFRSVPISAVRTFMYAFNSSFCFSNSTYLDFRARPKTMVRSSKVDGQGMI